MRITIGALVLTLMATSNQAAAYIVTIDSDEYVTWTDVSDAGPGVKLSTFTNWSGQATFDPLHVVDFDVANPEHDFDGLIGSRVFGHPSYLDSITTWNFSGRPRELWGDPNIPFFMFRADFAQPTDFVEVRSPFYDWMVDDAVIWAFDASGVLLNGCVFGAGPTPYTGTGFNAPPASEPSGLPCGERVQQSDCRYEYYCERVFTARIERVTSDVSYILVGGYYPTGNTMISVDRISYRVTTVPEPGTLALFGVGLLGAALSRRNKTRYARS